jgi:ABC-2 type transport system permease protein
MSRVAVVARQVRYEDLAFWRNPVAAVFTFVFPLIFMVLAQLVFVDRVGTGDTLPALFYTPAIVTFSVVNVCFVSIAMTVSLSRDEGVLKRIRGTPLSLAGYVAARVIHAMLITLLLTVIIVVTGGLLFGAPLPLGQLPLLALVLAVGASAFAALGLAVAGVIPNAHAAPAVVNAIVLPLYVVSDVFIPVEPGSAVATVAGLFPVSHLAAALRAAWLPGAQPLDPVDLVWVAGWGVLGLVVALRTFDWEPRA